MTRAIFGNWATLQIEGQIAAEMKRLSNAGDDTLAEKVRAGFRYVTMKDLRNIPISSWAVALESSLFYESLAAMGVLSERHGEDYSLGLLGFRTPKTLWEKAKYFIMGEVPAVEETNSKFI